MNHTFPTMPDEPPYVDDNPPCVRCGITYREWAEVGGFATRFEHPCTGNAYICRVATKLKQPGLNPSPQYRIEQGPNGGVQVPWREVKPWEMTSDELRKLVESCIEQKYRIGNVADLTNEIVNRPEVCPVLADALEDAGCQDAALLAALRTT